MVSVKNRQGVEYVWQASPAWPRHAPVLFPIVGRLKENSYVYNGENYSMSQHGFARDKDFTLITSTPSSCTFQLLSNEESRKIYPFDFIFNICYTLNGNELLTEYQVVNPSDAPLFFSVGAHPGFICPLTNNETLEDYFLEFESSDFKLSELSQGLRLPQKKKLSLSDKKLFLTKSLFDNDALVFENGQIQKISLCSSKSNHRISLSCKNWPYFGIWSKKENAGFICLEPWYGIADKTDHNLFLTEKQGVLRLEAKKEFDCSFSLKFD